MLGIEFSQVLSFLHCPKNIFVDIGSFLSEVETY